MGLVEFDQPKYCPNDQRTQSRVQSTVSSLLKRPGTCKDTPYFIRIPFCKILSEMTLQVCAANLQTRLEMMDSSAWKSHLPQNVPIKFVITFQVVAKRDGEDVSGEVKFVGFVRNPECFLALAHGPPAIGKPSSCFGKDLWQSLPARGSDR